jgi:hypothetical protein
MSDTLIEVYETKPGQPRPTTGCIEVIQVPQFGTIPNIGDQLAICRIDTFDRGGDKFRVVDRVFMFNHLRNNPKDESGNDVATYGKVWIFVERLP